MNEQKRERASEGRIGNKSTGAFKPEEWLKKGSELQAAAMLNRELFRRRRRSFHKRIRKPTIRRKDKARMWHELSGSPSASWLLLGYAIEMYLKAGLAKAYVGCAESMFKRDVKSRFSHDLKKISEEIAFPFEPGDKRMFRELKETLLAGRYPQFASDSADHMEKVNAQTNKEWSENNFKLLVALAVRVREHAESIDRDSNSPASKQFVRIDDDGYIAFRIGGHLPTRITYRLSSVQRRNGETKLHDVIDLLQQYDAFHQINRHWPNAMIFEDGENEKGQRVTFPRFYD